MTKPKADWISDWDHKEIMYRCGQCGTSFRTLTTRIKYCYNCGEKVDWKVPLKLKEAVYDYKEIEEIVKQINMRLQLEDENIIEGQTTIYDIHG